MNVALPKTSAFFAMPGFAPKGGYLGQMDFARVLMIALALHLAVIALLAFMPAKDDDVPVRTLSLKLGSPEAEQSSELLAEEFAPLPEIKPEMMPPKTLPVKTEPKPSPKVQPPLKEPVKPAAEKKIDPPKPVKQTKPTVKQQTRKKKPSAKSGGAKNVRVDSRSKQPEIPANVEVKVKMPSVFPPVNRIEGLSGVKKPADELARNPNGYMSNGRSTASPKAGDVQVGQADGQSTEAAIRARYEQKISAWLQQHRIYPEEARQSGQHGKPVLRIRINRRGDLRYFALDRSTGYELIDQAALEMVQRANPFPAPPEDYPGGVLLEFLIPVTFDLK